MFSSAKKALTAGVAALTLMGAVATTTTSAQAQIFYSYGPGYYGGYAPVTYGGYYGYNPAYYGGYYGPRYSYYPRHRSYNRGGAIAAGLIGGLALGALAASVARPAYQPVYTTCFIERRRTVRSSGRVSVRNVRVCR